MKIRYNEVKRCGREMLGFVSNMERELAQFKIRTQAFAGEMQDEISERAIALVTEVSEHLKKLRQAIEKGTETVGEGMEKLGITEKRRSGEIDRI